VHRRKDKSHATGELNREKGCNKAFAWLGKNANTLPGEAFSSSKKNRGEATSHRIERSVRGLARGPQPCRYERFSGRCVRFQAGRL